MHVIRLRGPWHYEPIAASGPVGDELPSISSGRVHLPVAADAPLHPEYRGRARFSRHFGEPTNLDAGQRVWLVLEGVDASATATFNGRPLQGEQQTASSRRFDITGQLAFRNELVLDAPWQGGLLGDVRLEIEE